MTTVRITDATVEPVTVDEAKLWCRVDNTDEDTLIASLIKAVRRSAEHRMQRTLIQTTWELVRDSFDPSLRLEMPKIMAVASVKYLDVDGVEQTLSPLDYVVDTDSEPGYVVPAYGKAWPSTYAQINAVRVRYTAGYGTTAAAVPEVFKQWMRLHIEHYYSNRGAAVIGTIVAPLPYADGLLDEGRVWLF
jgi:uncharacterized phiE125 gp8 family phage protein